jgi:sialic acid synthase SpsE
MLSSGLAHIHEIERALEWIHSVGEPPVAVLHCTASYPCPDEEVNLDALIDLHQSVGYRTPLGLSDHSLGNEAVLGAVTLGARLVEKHVTFDRSNPGPDHGFAIQVDEIPELLASMSRIAAMRGDGIKRPAPGEERGPRWRMRRGLYAARDIGEGSTLTPEDIAVQRPDAYIGAEFAPELEGRRVTRGIRAGEPLRWDWLERG